ncbi:hypothetical protein EDC04DRAFT_2895627 [Pisolithus marmoratus]|nr:hypothetical protein EDC04DRAFT_2895627 [Pisolithus marmoratus]
MSSPTEFLSSVELPSSSVLLPTTPLSSKLPSANFCTPPPQMKGRHSTVSNDLPRDNGRAHQKRDLTFSLPSDEPSRPSKKAKKILTSISAKRDNEVEDLHTLRMLQLARASREAFAAQVRLRLTRIHELDVMRTIAYDEYEEALELLRQADRQIGEVRQTISKRGTTIATVSSLRLSPVPTTSSVSSLDGISNDRSPSASPSRLNGLLRLVLILIIFTAMSSRSDSQPRGRRGSRNNPSQTRGQRRPITATNEFSTSSVPSFEPIPYISPPSSDIPGAFPHSASGASSQLERNVYNTYVASNPSESSSVTVNERLRAASGDDIRKDVDVLQQHQGSRGSRAPSQERLRAFGDALYAQAYASRQSSRTTSLANSSLISPRSDHSGFQVLGQKNSDLWRSYLARDQEVLGRARHLMIYEMVTNIGWPVISSGETARKLWKNTIREVLSQASAMIPGELLSPTKGTERLLMRTLTLFRADLASKAAPYARQFFPNHNPTSNSDKDNDYLKQKDKECACITNASAISNFFMHEHDEEGKIIRWFGNQRLEDFHICFWYTCDLSPMKVEAAKNVHSTPLQMYAMSAVALFYAIKRESKCVNETLPRIPFTGTEFSPTFEAYYDSLLNAMQHAVLGARLKDRFDWLHRQGLRKMQLAQTPLPSPEKQHNQILIPSADDIAVYESHPTVSQPLDMPTGHGNTVGGMTSMLNVGATRRASIPNYEIFLNDSHPHRPIDSVTSTAGASGGGISNEQHASSSTGWSMDFQGFGPTYYDYDL